MSRLLVVEDDEDMNEVLTGTLQGSGHEVASAFHGPQAIEMCKENNFDLVISDVRLPGMDGVETLEQIRKIRPRVKYIIITGYASSDTPVRAIRQRIDDYLFKPFSLQYLMDAVERVLLTPAERKSKWSLFQRVFSILGPSKDKELERLVLQRQAGFQALYVGVRSNCLTLKAACDVYIRLEHLEKKFRALLNAGEPDSKNLMIVRALYSDISNQINEFMEKRGEEAPSEGVVTRDQFRPLYEAIKNSEIGVEELQYAPVLREAPDGRLETLKELIEVKRKIWPAAPK